MIALVVLLVIGSAPSALPRQRQPASRAAGTNRASEIRLSPERLRTLAVNELGRVPVLEWHEVGEPGGQLSISRDAFWSELERLYQLGYRPVTLAEFSDGIFPIPAGTSPVVLTFDDGFKEHLTLDGDRPRPDSVVGMLGDFAQTHAGWRATAAFYVYWPAPFGDRRTAPAKLRWLVDHGFELGNHSLHHDYLSRTDDRGVQQSLALAQQAVSDAVPGYRFRSLALPFGAWPEHRELALFGEYEGVRYRHDVILLVGDMPTLSPNHQEFDPMGVMRVQAHDPENLARWLRWLEVPGRRFVSDGDPHVVTVPVSLRAAVRPRPGQDVATYPDEPDSSSTAALRAASASAIASSIVRTGSSPHPRPHVSSSS